jgi:RHS repeat-associated protein
MLLADELVTSLETPGETLWAIADHQGTVRDVVDSAGELRMHRVFDSYGNIVGETHYDAEGLEVESHEEGFVTVVFAFQGRYFDAATSLQNNLNRWFDAIVGSWISEDPIGHAGDPSNVYRPFANAPTMYVDPNGLANVWMPVTWGCANPSQSWWNMLNPFSSENFAALGGSAMGTAQGGLNIVNGV